jgi:hypothetical protein
MFGEGELGQALADRASHAQRRIARELGYLRGSPTGRDRDVVGERLLVQALPLGLTKPPAPPLGIGQVLRASVHLDVERERARLDLLLASRVLAAEPDLTPDQLQAKLEPLRAAEPLRGIGNLLWLPWRQEGTDEALLELRAGWFLPGQQVPVGEGRFVDPFAVVVPGSADLPELAIFAATEPIVRDLLHLELRLWSQATRSWGDPAGIVVNPAAALPMWDSTRGGWLVDAALGGEFPLDRGPQSFDDPRDDIQPHAILVRCVVAQPSEFAAEGLLAEPLEPQATSAMLINGDRFPGPPDGGWFKLRTEWIGYAAREGDQLRGLRRAQRGTTATDHPAGTRVHVGRSVEFVVPIPHAKDDWNG